MDGYRPDTYGPATYGDGFADVYDEWYTDLPDPMACAAHLHGLVGAGPVLELGVGTGRVALAMQAAGTTVIGLDASGEMLHALTTKLAAGSGAHGDAALEPVLADMAVLPLRPGCVAGAVATFNTLFNLTTEEAQRRCLAEVARVLRPGGALVVEAIVAPDPPERIDDVSVRTLAVDRLVLTASVLDPAAQTITGQHIEMTAAGNRLRPWMLRYLTTDQLDEMAAAVGLRLETRWSDWDRSPFDPTGRLHISTYRLI